MTPEQAKREYQAEFDAAADRFIEALMMKGDKPRCNLQGLSSSVQSYVRRTKQAKKPTPYPPQNKRGHFQ